MGAVQSHVGTVPRIREQGSPISHGPSNSTSQHPTLLGLPPQDGPYSIYAGSAISYRLFVGLV